MTPWLCEGLGVSGFCPLTSADTDGKEGPIYLGLHPAGAPRNSNDCDPLLEGHLPTTAYQVMELQDTHWIHPAAYRRVGVLR